MLLETCQEHSEKSRSCFCIFCSIHKPRFPSSGSFRFPWWDDASFLGGSKQATWEVHDILCSATSVTMSQFHHLNLCFKRVTSGNPDMHRNAISWPCIARPTSVAQNYLSKPHVPASPSTASCDIHPARRLSMLNAVHQHLKKYTDIIYRLDAEIQVVCSDSRYLSPCYTMEIYGTQHRFNLWQLICKTQSSPNKEVISAIERFRAASCHTMAAVQSRQTWIRFDLHLHWLHELLDFDVEDMGWTSITRPDQVKIKLRLHSQADLNPMNMLRWFKGSGSRFVAPVDS